MSEAIGAKHNKTMAAQPQPLSLDEFHKLYDGAKPVYEYWFGRAIQKPMPTILHGIVQFVIAMLLERGGWNTSTEVRLKVVPDAEPVPDVIAVRGKYTGSYPKKAPDLCIEILSPGDTLARALEKGYRYINWGSKCVWIIDPNQRTAWMFSREQGREPVWVPPDGVLRVQDTAIPLHDLFAEVDRKLESANPG